MASLVKGFAVDIVTDVIHNYRPNAKMKMMNIILLKEFHIFFEKSKIIIMATKRKILTKTIRW